MKVWESFYRRWDRLSPHRVQVAIENSHHILLNENFQLRKRLMELEKY